MDEEEVRSNFQMINLFFSELHFSFPEKPNMRGKIKLNAKITYDFDESWLDNLFGIRITTSVIDEKIDFKVKVICEAHFNLDKPNQQDDELLKNFRHNAVLIMFPFIRSQMVLLTSLPDRTGIRLPLIDINKFFSK